MRGLHISVINLLMAGLAGLRPNKIGCFLGPVGCCQERKGNEKSQDGNYRQSYVLKSAHGSPRHLMFRINSEEILGSCDPRRSP